MRYCKCSIISFFSLTSTANAFHNIHFSFSYISIFVCCKFYEIVNICLFILILLYPLLCRTLCSKWFNSVMMEGWLCLSCGVWKLIEFVDQEK